ncbi:MAG: hypothetical protein RLZZ01_107, partial [Actinomycetota bacterium]
ATGPCTGELQEAIIGDLKAVDIATVIAAGNDGWSDAVGYPACIPDAVTVGSTTNTDLVSSFSDTHPTVIDLYAPGSAILSALPDGSYASWNGTSMAAPHVAGAWALMRDGLGPGDDESVDGILARLQATGTPVSTRQPNVPLGFSHPRINIRSAFDSVGVPNDDFATAQDLGTLPATFEQQTVGATDEVDEPNPYCDSNASASIWYRWLPGGDGYLLVDTIGSDYDTVVAAYTGSTLGTLTDQACDVGTDDGEFMDSRIVVPVTDGVPVSIQVSGYLGDTGSLVLNASFLPPTYRPANDDLADAVELIDAGPIEVMTAGATDEASEPVPTCDADASSSVWFEWTAPADGTLTVDTIESNFDTVLVGFTGASLGSLTEVACDYGTVENDYTDATVSFPVTYGTTYLFQVTGIFGTVGSLVVNTGFVASELVRDLTLSLTGTGSVVSSPSGVSCPADCSGSFADGSSVTLTATPEAGSTFTGWGGSCSGSSPTCAVSMTQVRNVTATFAVPRTLTVSVSGDGSVVSSPSGISCPGDCSQSYTNGTSVTLTATPSGGSTFAGWSGACSGTGSCVVSMTQARSVTATFSAASFEPLSPVRLLDSRPGFSTVDGLFAGGGLLSGGSTLELVVAGRGGVASGAGAVSLNVAAVDPFGGGFLTVWPCGVVRPNASVVNYGAGQTVANAFTVPVGVGGKVCVYSSQTTHLIADVAGYYPG